MYSTNKPVCVATNVVAVAAGYWCSLFIKSDGTLWGMGANYAGALGIGSVVSTNKPVCIATNVVAVVAGYGHSLFIKTDGTLWAMGANDSGQLGIGTLNNTNRPAKVPSVMGGSRVIAAAAGYWHSMFLTTNGTLWAMGGNSIGQFGNGESTFSPQKSPTSVHDKVVAVAAGAFHALLLKSYPGPILLATGGNESGQLGNGRTNQATVSPVLVGFALIPARLLVASMFSANQTWHSLAIGRTQSMASVTLTNLRQPYTGSGISVTAFTSPPGLAVNLTYDGSPRAPIYAGSYQVAGTVSDPDYYGSGSDTLVIDKAEATVTIGNLHQTYDGKAKSVSETTNPQDLLVSLTYSNASYSPSANAPTNLGNYTVVASVSEDNYYGSATNTLTVGLPPQLFTAGTTTGREMTLQLTGTPDFPYILLTATNLTPPIEWQPALTNPADLDGRWQFTLTNLAGGQMFYRAAGP